MIPYLATCVDDKWERNDEYGPRLGEVVTIITEFWHEGRCYYRLREYPPVPGGVEGELHHTGYHWKCFERLTHGTFEEELKKLKITLPSYESY